MLNQICQVAAWRHHHRLECETYVTLKSKTAIDNVDYNPVLTFSNIRYIIRLVLLHHLGIIGEDTETQWIEFLRLCSSAM
jgi:hypothetical protein